MQKIIYLSIRAWNLNIFSYEYRVEKKKMRDCRIIERTWTHGGLDDAMFFKIQRKRNRLALFDAERIVVA